MAPFRTFCEAGPFAANACGRAQSRFLDVAPENSRDDFESIWLMDDAQAFTQPRLRVRVGSPTEDKTSRRPLPRN
jgi:hypothetical protein